MTDSFLASQRVTDARTTASNTDMNAAGAPASRPEPPPIIVGRVEGMTMFAKNTPLICIKQLP
ncbi:hypothetical protein, partial [Burkholderia sp. 22313]|uniref:hypothetical protein n=1 Tax=Burkholderia sp. 22313 TaxID=3453908 RepID=UPI003F853B6C